MLENRPEKAGNDNLRCSAKHMTLLSQLQMYIGGKMGDNRDLSLMINMLIMDIGVRGNMGGIAPVIINWKRMGRYLIAYIEDYEEDVCYYRIFRYPELSFYEEYRILYPSYEEEKYECLYDSKERGKSRTQLYIAKKPWIDEFLALCEGYYKG